MQIDDKLLNLSPGMAVIVEIKTGTRRIIDYLLPPILRHSQESLRERWLGLRRVAANAAFQALRKKFLVRHFYFLEGVPGFAFSPIFRSARRHTHVVSRMSVARL